MTDTVVIVTPVVNTVEVPGGTVVLASQTVNTVEVPGATVMLVNTVVNTVEVLGQTAVAVVREDVVQIVTAGLQGPAGPGAALVYEYPQASASAVWTVPHNLNRYPGVTVTDNLGNVVLADVAYVDANVVRITHAMAQVGMAYCN